MRYLSYERNGTRGVAEVDGDLLVPLDGVVRIDATTTTDVLRAARRMRDDAFPRADAAVLPVSVPAKVLCVGLNYRSHVAETKRELPTYPVLFPKYASTLIGADTAIALPGESTQVDYEGELAVVIGRPGRRIAESNALEHVLGYAAANDVTMRDYQYRTHQWLQGKAWDASTPVGPTITTVDAFDLTSPSIRTLLNGEVVQESDLSRLIFSIPRLIATISEFTELEAGDVLLTGTPAGVGYRRDPQRFLQQGDEVVVEIEGLDPLRSSVLAEREVAHV